MQIIKQSQSIKIKYTDASGRIVTEPITSDAVDVLHWYWNNIPAND